MSEINFDTSAELLITCKKGDTFVWNLTDVQIDDVDIDATYSAVMKVRSSEGATPLFQWETPNEITITSGAISIEVDDATMNVQSGIYQYDLKVTDPDGVKKTWLYGTFRINPSFS